MKRIAYADAVVGTDGEVADLVIEYAGRLAQLGQADVVRIPAVTQDGRLQEVALLLGPASLITVTTDDVAFAGDPGPAVEDLRRRVARLSAEIPTDPDPGPEGLDDLEDLDGVALPNE